MTEGGPFVDGQVQFADLTGNGREDMIFQGVNEPVLGLALDRDGLPRPQLWATEGGPFVVGKAQYADLTGDGKADLIYRGIDNRFWVSLSTGTGFLRSSALGGRGRTLPERPGPVRRPDGRRKGGPDLPGRRQPVLGLALDRHRLRPAPALGDRGRALHRRPSPVRRTQRRRQGGPHLPVGG